MESVQSSHFELTMMTSLPFSLSLSLSLSASHAQCTKRFRAWYHKPGFRVIMRWLKLDTEKLTCAESKKRHKTGWNVLHHQVIQCQNQAGVDCCQTFRSLFIYYTKWSHHGSKIKQEDGHKKKAQPQTNFPSQKTGKAVSCGKQFTGSNTHIQRSYCMRNDRVSQIRSSNDAKFDKEVYTAEKLVALLSEQTAPFSRWQRFRRTDVGSYKFEQWLDQ